MDLLTLPDDNVPPIGSIETLNDGGSDVLIKRFVEETEPYMIPAYREFKVDTFKGFLTNMHYDLSESKVIGIANSDFAVITSLPDKAEIIEVFKFYDFEDNLPSLNEQGEIALNGLYTSAHDKVYKLIGPYSEEGVQIIVRGKIWNRPVGINDRYADILTGSIPAFGSLYNNRYAALSALHELWHLRNFSVNTTELEQEIAASNYALSVVHHLRTLGIRIFEGEIGEAKAYLEGYLEGYVKKNRQTLRLVNPKGKFDRIRHPKK